VVSDIERRLEILLPARSITGVNDGAFKVDGGADAGVSKNGAGISDVEEERKLCGKPSMSVRSVDSGFPRNSRTRIHPQTSSASRDEL
jgi:hypothetical protein